MKLDGDGLLKDIEYEINKLLEEIDNAVGNNWYTKAAALSIEMDGVAKVRSMIRLGDRIIKER